MLLITWTRPTGLASEDNPHEAITHERDMAVRTAALNDSMNLVPAEAPCLVSFKHHYTHPSLYSDADEKMQSSALHRSPSILSAALWPRVRRLSLMSTHQQQQPWVFSQPNYLPNYYHPHYLLPPSQLPPLYHLPTAASSRRRLERYFHPLTETSF
jgi:hypothetical protein